MPEGDRRLSLNALPEHRNLAIGGNVPGFSELIAAGVRKFDCGVQRQRFGCGLWPKIIR